jgi:NADPH-ferrihemoprotein reductase
VFGLGNKQYEHFCAVGRKVHKAMQDVGATPIVDLGIGDDDDDIENDFDIWSTDLFAALESSSVLDASAMVVTSDSVFSYDIEDATTTAEPVDVVIVGSGLNQSSPHLATVSVAKELHTANSDRSCVHLELDIGNNQATYEAGDHIAVFAENSADIVAAAAEALGMDLNTRFKMKLPSGTTGITIPPSGVLTICGALSRYADLLSSPSKAALSALAVFATEETESDRLAELASIEGRDAYNSYIIADKRSLLEVLQDFPSAKPSLGAFFGTIAPRLQPRFYSISSSPSLHPRSVHITVAVVRDTMPSGRIHNGVASSWLAKLKPGAQVPVFIRQSSFKLPKDPLTPVIMVGPGTGIAPFRGFIQERAALLSKGTNLGPGALYFGCRREDQDYIYQEELESYLASEAISELNVAFSRQNATKDYVQHHIARQGDLVWKILNNGGYFYICGEAKHMAKDVNEALVQIVSNAKGGNADAGEAFIKTLGNSGRYLKDVW